MARFAAIDDNMRHIADAADKIAFGGRREPVNPGLQKADRRGDFAYPKSKSSGGEKQNNKAVYDEFCQINPFEDDGASSNFIVSEGQSKANAPQNLSAYDELDQRDPFEEGFSGDFSSLSPSAAVQKTEWTDAASRALEMKRVAADKRRGRGAALNPKGRFERISGEAVRGDSAGDFADPSEIAPIKTEVQEEKPRCIISSNDSPDIPYDRSINPYRGCEHGCIYCYARPSHSYMGLSAGLDFETRLFAKPDAAQLLRRELAHPGYKPKLIAMGSNTDPYQPIEKQYQITRSILNVLYEARHPIIITTKSALILRDSDILSALAKERLVHVSISVETLDGKLARLMDPRAAAPAKRLNAVSELAKIGVPVSVLLAPVIPALNDHEIENIAEAAAKAGAKTMNYALLRLPHEVAPLFKDWLLREYPGKYRRVMGQLRMMRGGKENETRPHDRMCGQGVMAVLLARRFQMAAERFGLNRERTGLTRRLFHVPENWRNADSFGMAAQRKIREKDKIKQVTAEKIEQLSLF